MNSNATNAIEEQFATLPDPAPSRWPLTPEEINRVAFIWQRFPHILPPYNGLNAEEAVLVHRYFTGQEPFDALVSVNRSRAKRQQNENDTTDRP